MKDFLLDIVAHTQALGCIDTIKVVGDDKATQIEALSDDKSVVIQASFKQANLDFKGTFGMPNLGKLTTILGIQEYKENAKLSITTRKDTGAPDGINFENAAGDFKNDYRFMSTAVINDQLKNIKMKQVKWNVEVTPSAASIQKLKFQSQAHSDATSFSTKIENGDLKFFFGDHSSPTLVLSSEPPLYPSR